MTEIAHALVYLGDRPADSEAPAHNDNSLTGAFLTAGAFAALMIASPQLRAAEPVSPLAQGLLGMRPTDDAPSAQKFATPDGSMRFTLDRSSGHTALMRFDGRDEVLALTPTPGPRGDEFLKNDTGRVVVKVSAMGSVTVYGGAHADGAPATSAGRASPLSPLTMPVGGLTAKLSEIERATGKAVGHPVSFDGPAGNALTNSTAVGLVADAAERAAEGLATARPAAVKRVIIQFGARPEARLEQDALRVVVAPQLGYAGRPSADAVKAALATTSR